MPRGVDDPTGADAGSGVDIRTLIRTKRRGGSLTAAQIGSFVADLERTDRAQVAALLMAGVLAGFSRDEAVALTRALTSSGIVLDLSSVGLPTVDKHSTGGIGDTTTLVVAPVLAACGLGVAKLSGRALGHTGGTIDKLEAIPGMRHDLDAAALRAQVDRIGIAIASATRDLAPADSTLYALRDATETVDDVALIAASVMSKKLAGGAEHVILDVKTGGGAFLTSPDRSRALAELCVEIGTEAGRAVGALITDMSQPLGPAVGEALEVTAAVRVLRGEAAGRLRAVSVALATAALRLTGRSEGEASSRIEAVLASGQALEKFREFIEAQGGDPRVTEPSSSVLGRAPVVRTWAAPAGVVQAIDATALGPIAHRLAGAGSRRDPTAGLEVLVGVGDEVGPDGPAMRVHARTERDARWVLEQLPELIVVGPASAVAPSLIVSRVGLPGPGDGGR
jgi:pyrimidine-nucleoside phosphorylase